MFSFRIDLDFKKLINASGLGFCRSAMELRYNSKGLTSVKLREMLRALPLEKSIGVELIDLYNNKLTFVPGELMDKDRFPSLLDLDLSRNELRRLPTGLGRHRLEALYTAGNPCHPSSLARDCHVIQEAQQLQQDIIVANRLFDVSFRAALLFLVAHRFDPLSALASLPRDVVVFLARCIISSAVEEYYD